MVTSFSILVLLVVAAALIIRPFRSSGALLELIRFSELWQWHGTVDRKNYVLVGVVGLAIKHNIDRIVATAVFGRRFTPWNYWIPPVDAIRINSLSPADSRFLATMAIIALPFIWIGLAMTVRRLRSTGLPLWLVLFFFIPIGNLAFFLVLSLIPARAGAGDIDVGHPSPVGSFIPRDKLGSSAMAVALIGSIGALITYVGVQRLGTYGWGVFVALPFCFGLLSVLIYSCHERRTLKSCLAVSMISVGIVGLALFAFAIEGLICIVMALPLAIPLALLGGTVGFFAQRHQAIPRQATSTMLLLVFLPLGMMTSETIIPSEPQRTSVRTTLRINAPAEQVWKNLIAFPDIGQPTVSLFRLGVSYPIRAAIHGQGVGAIRECLFSTGTFVERIDAWEERKHFGFTVLSGPEGMRELSPYDIHPRHLHGYFVPESAEFRLISNPDGSTQLEGISWYRNSMWPSAYWRLWSDAILHQVHMRVFEHVKVLSEGATRGSIEKHRDTKTQRHKGA